MHTVLGAPQVLIDPWLRIHFKVKWPLQFLIDQLFKYLLNTNYMPNIVINTVKYLGPFKDAGAKNIQDKSECMILHSIRVDPWHMADVATPADISPKPCAWR